MAGQYRDIHARSIQVFTECAFVGILDADKEGFLRSETSLIQTIGRAATYRDQLSKLRMKELDILSPVGTVAHKKRREKGKSGGRRNR